MNIEETIIKRKETFINYIKKIVYYSKNKQIDNSFANDILMDLYLMIKDKEMNDPFSFMIKSIRNQLYDNNNIISKNYFNKLNTELYDMSESIEEDDKLPCFFEVYNHIDSIFYSAQTILYWFDRDIFNIYYSSEISLGKLSKQLDIPKSSLNVSIQNCKKELNLNNFQMKCLLFHKKMFKIKTKENKTTY